jgi:hypothetical protein
MRAFVAAYGLFQKGCVSIVPSASFWREGVQPKRVKRTVTSPVCVAYRGMTVLNCLGLWLCLYM